MAFAPACKETFINKLYKKDLAGFVGDSNACLRNL
jgi:hypothetical protein